MDSKITTIAIPQTTGVGPSTEVKAIIQSLAPGTVLDVLISSRDNQAGIYLKGTFLPAVLPQNISLGERVKVQVADTTDQLILKLLDQPEGDFFSSVGSGSSTPSLGQIIPQSKLSPLRLGSVLSSIPIDIPTNTTQGALPHEATTVIRSLIDRLIAKHALIGDSQANESTKLQQAISDHLGKNTKDALIEAKDTLRAIINEISKSGPYNSLNRTTMKILEQVFNEVSKNNEEEAPLEQILKAFTRIAQEPDSPRQELVSAPQVIRDIAKSLLQKLNGERAEKIPLFDSLDKETRHLLDTITKELNTLKDNGVTDSQVKVFLKRALNDIQNRLGAMNHSAEQQESTLGGLKVIQNVEKILSGQEILNSLNPVMQAVGEPALVMIPSFLSGLLAKWELSIAPRPPEEEESERTNKVQPYQRLKLFLPLPNLGDIEVDIAHRKNEVLVRLVTENEAVVSFIQQKSSTLDDAFQALGYVRNMVTAQRGIPRRITPDWYREIAIPDMRV